MWSAIRENAVHVLSAVVRTHKVQVTKQDPGFRAAGMCRISGQPHNFYCGLLYLPFIELSCNTG